MDNIQELKILKKIKEIRQIKGHGTELISLYIKKNSNISDILKKIRKELDEAGNIKNKKIKKKVTINLEYILKNIVEKDLNKGIIFFVGFKNENSWIREKITGFNINNLYVCDEKFHTLELEKKLKFKKKNYGIIVLDRKEATFGLFNENEITILEKINSDVPGKHRAGGQSSRRFERLIELAEYEFFKIISKTINSIYNDKNIFGFIIGGPGMTKEKFLRNNNNIFKTKKILNITNTGYTDESGIEEAIENSKEILSKTKFQQEKNFFQEFLKNYQKKKYNYGLKNLNNQNLFKIGTILISENIFFSTINLKECNFCKQFFCDITLKKCNCGNELYFLKKSGFELFSKIPTIFIVDNFFEYWLSLTNNFEQIIYKFV